MEKVLNEATRISIVKDTNSTTKEVENMVRKAETLKSLDALNLSSHTQKLVEKYLGTDIQSVIRAGRINALNDDKSPEYADYYPEYKYELVKALDEAGFIRHDLYPRTWRVWGFYNAVVNRFSLASGTVYSLATLINREDFTSSEIYENMPAVSDEEFEKLMNVLDMLTEKERTVLILRFGLDGGIPKTLEQVGSMFYVTRERIRQYEAKALRKIRKRSRLCRLPALFGFIPPAEPEPKKYFSTNGTEHIGIDADIYDLGLSVRAYNCLKRFSTINTIEDILNYPKEDWPKIKNLGSKAVLEIQDRMRAAGYSEFSINPLS